MKSTNLTISTDPYLREVLVVNMLCPERTPLVFIMQTKYAYNLFASQTSVGGCLSEPVLHVGVAGRSL